MEEEKKKAYSEVVEILKLIDDEERLEKIPFEVIELIKRNSDPTYKPTISKEKPLEEQNLMDETYAILGWIANKYWEENLYETSKEENIFIRDLREEFVRDFVFPMFRANAIYEGEYLLGTSIARPLIAKHLIDIAATTKADAISHGATGKGNDQVRFEIGAYALNPNIKVIAPWREWDLNSREKLLAYAEKNGIDIAKKPGKSPYSMDANLLHISYEGLVLEDPAARPQDDMWRWSLSPQDAPNEVTTIEIEYKNGDPVALNGKALKPHEMLAALNELGAKNGIGRLDIVENLLPCRHQS